MDIVSVIIPTLNEKKGIKEVINDLPREELRNMGYEVEVLAVDGGSSDGTVEILKNLEVKIIHSKGGKAEGVREGLKNVRGSLIFLIDGDGTYPAQKIPDMVKEFEEGHQMVLGSRFRGEICDGAMTTKNKIGNKVLTWLANGLYGTDTSDLCTGLRGFSTYDLDPDEISSSGFEIEAELHTLFSEKNISEIPIEYRDRKGESKLVTFDGVKIALRLLREKF
ncbi:MAG: glycosyltransferase [Candidatus Thermoplasmatota archaeon]